MICQHWPWEMPPRAQKVLRQQTRLNRHYKKMMTGHVNLTGRRPNKQAGTQALLETAHQANRYVFSSDLLDPRYREKPETKGRPGNRD